MENRELYQDSFNEDLDEEIDNELPIFKVLLSDASEIKIYLTWSSDLVPEIQTWNNQTLTEILQSIESDSESREESKAEISETTSQGMVHQNANNPSIVDLFKQNWIDLVNQNSEDQLARIFSNFLRLDKINNSERINSWKMMSSSYWFPGDRVWKCTKLKSVYWTDMPWFDWEIHNELLLRRKGKKLTPIQVAHIWEWLRIQPNHHELVRSIYKLSDSTYYRLKSSRYKQTCVSQNITLLNEINILKYKDIRREIQNFMNLQRSQ